MQSTTDTAGSQNRQCTGIHRLRRLTPILSEHLRKGSPDYHWAWCMRTLGFPSSDEQCTADDFAQASEFECGDVFWGYDAFAAPVYRAFYSAWRGLAIGRFACPLTESLAGPRAPKWFFARLPASSRMDTTNGGQPVFRELNAGRDEVPLVVDVRPHNTADITIDLQVQLAPGAWLADRTRYVVAIKRFRGAEECNVNQ